MEYKKRFGYFTSQLLTRHGAGGKKLWPDVKVTIGPAIENGFYYDFDKKEPFSDQDLKKIEKEMWHIINKKMPFVHSELSQQDAIALFEKMQEEYKVELIKDIGEEKVSIYKTGEEFVDLCKGPHVENTGKIKAFKLLSVAGAYWRGDEKRPMLQRIYGTCFFSDEELKKYLTLLEEIPEKEIIASWEHNSTCSAPIRTGRRPRPLASQRRFDSSFVRRVLQKRTPCCRL